MRPAAILVGQQPKIQKSDSTEARADHPRSVHLRRPPTRRSGTPEPPPWGLQFGDTCNGAGVDTERVATPSAAARLRLLPDHKRHIKFPPALCRCASVPDEEQVSVRGFSGFDRLGIEHPQFKLDVVGVPQCDERPSILLLDPRVGDPKLIQMRRPVLKRRTITNPQCKVIEPHRTFVETIAHRAIMNQEANRQTAWVVHAPTPEARSSELGNQPEPQDVGPPSHASLGVSHGEVDVPEAFDSRDRHSRIHSVDVPCPFGLAKTSEGAPSACRGSIER